MTAQVAPEPPDTDTREALFPVSVVPFDALLASASPSTSSGLGMRMPTIREDIENLHSQAGAMTSAAVTMVAQFWGTYLSTTDTGITHISLPVSSPEEVRRLRDEISRRTRLTRQQIARAIGVDRRSLTSWANGSSAPASERLERLRYLAALVREIDAQKPGRATEVLLSRRGQEDLLDAISWGQFEKASAWQSRANHLASVRVVRRESRKPPLYQAALNAYLAGELGAPGRAHVVRAPELYEQDLSRAERLLPDEVPRRGRQGYR
jgi:transcriptional regulator with XRE-family HTH domain